MTLVPSAAAALTLEVFCCLELSLCLFRCCFGGLEASGSTLQAVLRVYPQAARRLQNNTRTVAATSSSSVVDCNGLLHQWACRVGACGGLANQARLAVLESGQAHTQPSTLYSGCLSSLDGSGTTHKTTPAKLTPRSAFGFGLAGMWVVGMLVVASGVLFGVLRVLCLDTGSQSLGQSSVSGAGLPTSP